MVAQTARVAIDLVASSPWSRHQGRHVARRRPGRVAVRPQQAGGPDCFLLDGPRGNPDHAESLLQGGNNAAIAPEAFRNPRLPLATLHGETGSFAMRFS